MSLRYFLGKLALLAAAGLPLAAPAASDGASAGERIYRSGVLASGQPLKGAAANGVLRQGKDAACIACHRRSGFGIAEGPFVVRPITGADLFQNRAPVAASARIAHQLGKSLRPPYDEAALAATIRTGVDVSGRTMSALMPRYALGDGDMRALVAYLRTLSDAAPAGVDEQQIHLATVIQPQVPAAQRRAMLAVLDAFVQDKNAQVRSELVRRRAGGMRMHRAYRTWVLHRWELSGPEQGWEAQLEQFYRQQPVFALVSGIGDASWAPIGAFSERRELPCILPMTMLPASAPDQFYTVYFSRGVMLEAEGLARRLAVDPQARKLVQVYRAGDPAGVAAAAAFRAALPDAAARLTDRPLGAPAPAGLGEAAGAAQDDLVLWLDAAELARAGAAPAARRLFLSYSMQGAAPPAGWDRAVVVAPWEAGALQAARLRRPLDWLRARGIAGAEAEVQVNALFAIAIAGDALAHIMDSFSREYFVEQVEHIVTTTLLPSMYPRLSLGPDQRFAAKEVYLGAQAPPPEEKK